MSYQSLYTAAQTRELDRCTIEDHGVPGIRLMSRAGRAAFDLLLEEWPAPTELHIYCGTGNNGGDGYIIAALAQGRGIPVRVLQLGDESRIDGDALKARERALADGVVVQKFDPAEEPEQGVIVDSMLGTGLGGEVRDEYRAAIEVINASPCPVLAIDIPSGLCSDTGRVLGAAVRADVTVTFIGVKRGLLTADAPDFVGYLAYDELEVPAGVYESLPVECFHLDLDIALDSFPGHAETAHKGSFGHALVVGGNRGMGGAAVMAAEAAARCGAGLVSAATQPEHLAAFIARRPEVMAHGVSGGNDLLPMLERPSVIAVGPGLGSDAWAEQLFYRCLGTGMPLVVDADALNLLAAGDILDKPVRDNWILTPHPGEAARLLKCTTAEIQSDRFAAVSALQERYGGVVVLKGAGSLVCGGAEVFVSSYGNPGMGSGGMGDVLSGVLAGLLARGMAPLEAACLGVCLHSCAADLAAEEGEAGLLATDLMPWLRLLLDA